MGKQKVQTYADQRN